MSRRPTQKEKIEMYESLLHDINLFASVTMDTEIMRELITNICNWSYAHRCGNGELSDRAQNKIIYNAFWKLRKHGPSYYERKKVSIDEAKKQSDS